MGKFSGDLPSQSTFDIIERIHASPDLLTHQFALLGVTDPKQTATRVGKAGLTLVPTDVPWKGKKRPSFAKQERAAPAPLVPAPSKMAPEATHDREFAAKGALWRKRDFEALPVSIYSRSRGEQPWRPIRALLFWVARDYVRKWLFRGTVVLACIGCDASVSTLKNTQAPLAPIIETGSIASEIPLPPPQALPDHPTSKKRKRAKSPQRKAQPRWWEKMLGIEPAPAKRS